MHLFLNCSEIHTKGLYRNHEIPLHITFNFQSLIHKDISSRWCAKRKSPLFYIPYIFHSEVGSSMFSSLNRIEKKIWKILLNEWKKWLLPIYVRILGRFVFSDDWNLFRKLETLKLVCVFFVFCTYYAIMDVDFMVFRHSPIFCILDNFWNHYNALMVLRGLCVNVR